MRALRTLTRRRVAGDRQAARKPSRTTPRAARSPRDRSTPQRPARHAAQGGRRRPGSAAPWSTTTSSSTAAPPRWSSRGLLRRVRPGHRRRCCRWPPSASRTPPGRSARFFLGHFGDRFGRKKIMVFTLILMGVSTFLIGCLPTCDQVGIARAGPAGPAARAAGPLGGRRAGQRQLHDAGTRARGPPRLLHQLHPQRHPGRADPGHPGLHPGRRAARGAAAVLGLADPVLAERRGRRGRLRHPPHAGRDPGLRPARPPSEGVAKLPLAVLFREHWADVLRVVCGRAHRLGQHDLHASGRWPTPPATVGIEPRTMLWVGALANVVALVAIPLWATLSDRIGRSPVFLVGAARQRGDDVRLPVGRSPPATYAADLRLGMLTVRRRLQRRQRRLALLLRRDVHHPGPAVGHGDRHADRLRDRRLRGRLGRRHGLPVGLAGPAGLGRGRDLHRRPVRDQRDRGGDRPRRRTRPDRGARPRPAAPAQRHHGRLTPRLTLPGAGPWLRTRKHRRRDGAILLVIGPNYWYARAMSDRLDDLERRIDELRAGVRKAMRVKDTATARTLRAELRTAERAWDALVSGDGRRRGTARG